jgi:hypothetical protein
MLAGCGLGFGHGSLASQDVKKQAREYRDLKITVEDPGPWVVMNGKTAPELKVTVANTGKMKIGYIKMVGILLGGSAYQDAQTVVPLDGAGKQRLAQKKGLLTFTVKFAEKTVNEGTLMAARANYQFEVTEVGFAD